MAVLAGGAGTSEFEVNIRWASSFADIASFCDAEHTLIKIIVNDVQKLKCKALHQSIISYQFAGECKFLFNSKLLQIPLAFA